jgi:hypothetical protein
MPEKEEAGNRTVQGTGNVSMKRPEPARGLMPMAMGWLDLSRERFGEF